MKKIILSIAILFVANSTMAQSKELIQAYSIVLESKQDIQTQSVEVNVDNSSNENSYPCTPLNARRNEENISTQVLKSTMENMENKSKVKK